MGEVIDPLSLRALELTYILPHVGHAVLRTDTLIATSAQTSSGKAPVERREFSALKLERKHR